jgi:hypothetical protein
MFGGRSRLMKVLGAPVFLSRSLLRPQLNRYRLARSGNLLVVEVNSWVGLFAHLEWFLEISVHCERHGLKPCFMSTSPQYVDPKRGPDWYDYFFTNPQLSPEDRERIVTGDVPICRIDGIRQMGLPENYDLILNLQDAPHLVRKYIGVKPEVTEQVQTFARESFAGRTVLGVHYRGTDKAAEAPRLSYEDVHRSIEAFLVEHPEFDCLFVSSDEQAFVDFIESAFQSSIPVVYHEDRERSRAGVAIHRSRSGERFRKAEEAVVNCLLLSRCDALIKTPSILSGWSRLFNPDLPVILLASPFAGQLWFPDRDLLLETPSRWIARTGLAAAASH